MAEQSNNLGLRIRHRRRVKGLRLSDLAQIVGCSESMLSKIEHGKANPSLKNLHKIAEALELSASALFHPDEDGDIVARNGTRPTLNISTIRSGTDIVLEGLSPHNPGRLLQVNIHIISPGGHTDGEYSHEGEDLGYVLEGELELSVNGKVYNLTEGDSFLFRSEHQHAYRNPGKKITRVLWVNTPPSF